jgi:hypothetical protein
MSEENTTIETTEQAIEELTPLTSWDDTEGDFTPETTLMNQAVEQGTKEADDNVKASLVENKEVETDSTESENSVQEVKEEVKEEITAKPDETVEESKPEVIKLKVNGKEEEVSLDDLKSNYSGKVAYDKKFTELDKERKAFINEKTQIESYVNEFRNIAQSQNMVEATKFLGQLTGQAPHDVVNSLIDSLAPEIERRYSLTDDEIDLENKKAEINFQKEKMETERAQLEAKQSQSTLQASIENEMSNHNISSEDWDKAIHTLDSRLPKDEVITPELVSEYVVFERANTKTESVLDSYNDGKFAGNEEVVKGLRQVVIDNPDFNDQDLTEILNDALNTTQKQQVEEKLTKKVSSNETNKKEDAPTYSSPASWDDIL